MTSRWVGIVCGPSLADGPPAHLDATLESLLDGRADLVSTHVDRSGVVASVVVAARVSRLPSLDEVATRLGGPAEVDPADGPAGRAVTAARSGTDGRCVLFPGQVLLGGTHTVAEIVDTSAIDRVIGVGVPVEPDTVVVTGGFLRPTFVRGRLVLLVEPVAGGVGPIEHAEPHQCCGH